MDINQDDLNLAADLVATCWSTEGFKAVAAGVPTIFYLLNSAQKELGEKRNLPYPYVPAIKSGEAIGVFSWKETLDAFERVLALKEKLEARPVIEYKSSAERAADVIMNI